MHATAVPNPAVGGMRVLLSEASSLTAREFVTVLGRDGVAVEAVTASSLPIARFSRWCAAVHRAPAPSADPIGYLQVVDQLMASGRFDALLPTHEQAWLFAVGHDLLPHTAVAVASVQAFEHVESKVAFARLLDTTGLPQPAWHLVHDEADLDLLGFPIWVKASFSTAGRGVRLAADHQQAVAAWRELTAARAGELMIQAPAHGTYAQVQGLFEHGRLVGAAASEQLALGVGGSAAARVSVDHAQAVNALDRLGSHLSWHGGLALDYFHQDGVPQFIECNPRITEPGNAAAAGVNFPELMIALATGRNTLTRQPLVAKAGIRTRSTMAMALGAAEVSATRRAILSATTTSMMRRAQFESSSEVLTPVLTDPPSIIPLLITISAVLIRPTNAARLATNTIANYEVTPQAVAQIRHTPST